MKISTPFNEFTRYESGTTDNEFLKNSLRFHNAFASREYSSPPPPLPPLPLPLPQYHYYYYLHVYGFASFPSNVFSSILIMWEIITTPCTVQLCGFRCRRTKVTLLQQYALGSLILNGSIWNTVVMYAEYGG